MDRVEILKRLAHSLNARNYLEIGVFKGSVLFALRIPRKVAVDPSPRFKFRHKLRHSLRNPTNLFNAYHRMTSDAYFREVRPAPNSFDLVFIDGLHTYAQALRDAENALGVLRPGGVIAMHDCNPPHEAAAYPAASLADAAATCPPGWTGEWCGDVWKAIVHLNATRPDLEVAVLDCDYGVGLLRPAPAGPAPGIDITGLAAWPYRRLAEDRAALLNLKPPAYLDRWIASHGRGRAG